MREVIRKHYGVGTPTETERQEYADAVVAAAVAETGDAAEVDPNLHDSAYESYATRDDKLKHELETNCNVPEDQIENIFAASNIEILQNRKNRLEAARAAEVLENGAEDNPVIESIDKAIEALQSRLDELGTATEIAAILQAKSTFINGLSFVNPDDNSDQGNRAIRAKRLIETRELAELVIEAFCVNEDNWLIVK